ncbi:TetR/AcrR family transcriptional regulator [Pseudoxanthomonas sp.]|uniref:TetR/AcrR family transcriptional regulator n=1 Tax=Pseudoxanthomonas sp. TaxID=1871049 RepID=UPI002634EEEF|nr:TetR/AcrR family transcriptional regulator [Pseudoxanthomonas sp.]WDS36929.1 MAG: TetR/AcrR family transcriptional regulator [Pseudoxanthomonas sp.]
MSYKKRPPADVRTPVKHARILRRAQVKAEATAPLSAAALADKSPTRRTQEQRRLEAEARLLDAALLLVARKGWAGMTLAEVGTAAGYSRSLVAHHFGSKPKLLQALAMHIGRNFIASFGQRLESSEGLPAIAQFIEAYLGRSHAEWTNTRALLILMAEGTTDDSEAGANLAAYNERSIKYLRRLFDIGIQNGDVRADIDSKAAATLLLGSLRGVMLQSFQQKTIVDLPRLRNEVVTMFLRYAASRPAEALVQYQCGWGGADTPPGAGAAK